MGGRETRSGESRDDKTWLNETVLKNYERVKKTAYYRARGHGVPAPEQWAEDMTQETFLRLAQSLKDGKIDTDKDASTWLIVTLGNVIGSDWQKHCHQEISVEEIRGSAEEPGRELETEELFPPGLKEGERELIYQCDYLGYSTKEVACRLGISETACRMRLYRAEKNYRALYKKSQPSTNFEGIRQEEEHILSKGGAKNV